MRTIDPKTPPSTLSQAALKPASAEPQLAPKDGPRAAPADAYAPATGPQHQPASHAAVLAGRSPPGVLQSFATNLRHYVRDAHQSVSETLAAGAQPFAGELAFGVDTWTHFDAHPPAAALRPSGASAARQPTQAAHKGATHGPQATINLTSKAAHTAEVLGAGWLESYGEMAALQRTPVYQAYKHGMMAVRLLSGTVSPAQLGMWAGSTLLLPVLDAHFPAASMPARISLQAAAMVVDPLGTAAGLASLAALRVALEYAPPAQRDFWRCMIFLASRQFSSVLVHAAMTPA